jgi:hypothetical protein
LELEAHGSGSKNLKNRSGDSFGYSASRLSLKRAVTSTFFVGNGAMKHSALAASIEADASRVVGGIFSRGSNGSILTNEASGHFWQNWTPQVRQQFIDFMDSMGVPVTHTAGH